MPLGQGRAPFQFCMPKPPLLISCSQIATQRCLISLSLCLTWPQGGAEELLSSAWRDKPVRPHTSGPRCGWGLGLWDFRALKENWKSVCSGGRSVHPKSENSLYQEQDKLYRACREEMERENCGGLWRLWNWLCVILSELLRLSESQFPNL